MSMYLFKLGRFARGLRITALLCLAIFAGASVAEAAHVHDDEAVEITFECVACKVAQNIDGLQPYPLGSITGQDSFQHFFSQAIESVQDATGSAFSARAPPPS